MIDLFNGTNILLALMTIITVLIILAFVAADSEEEQT